ncbi:MAG: hypothetical protein Kow0068_25960 [Marinilabiliales bacterium]
MNKIQKDTEAKILEAAEKEFIINGMAGARMQEIANRAGINKALLHYYYRSKEKLFTHVFKIAIAKFIPKIGELLKSDMKLFDFIKEFVAQYGKIILKNQFIPLFVLSELRRNPDMLADVILSSGINPSLFAKKINEAKQQGLIIDVDPKSIILNMLSMIIFPVAARPLIQRLLFDNKEKEYEAYLEKRLEEIPDFIINSIKIKQS